MELNPAPFLTHQGAIERDGLDLKMHLSKDSYLCCGAAGSSEASPDHSGGGALHPWPAAGPSDA